MGPPIWSCWVGNEDGGHLGALGVPGGAFVFINQNNPPTAVAVEQATPSDFVLGANYPNPFNPATTIPLSVPDSAETVDVAIYNISGQLVRQVWSGPLAAGEHRLTWDGRDDEGQPVASGAYLYQGTRGRSVAHPENGQARIDDSTVDNTSAIQKQGYIRPLDYLEDISMIRINTLNRCGETLTIEMMGYIRKTEFDILYDFLQSQVEEGVREVSIVGQ